MKKSPAAARSGITGLLFVFCLTALIVGLGFDLGAGARLKFWIGDQPGAAAAIGAAVVLFVVVATHAARFALGRRQKADEGSSDGAHS